MKIYAVGGYNEVGKNMTVVDLGEDAFIFDCGLFLPAVVALQERDKVTNEKTLREIGALPHDHILDHKGIREKVRAILLSHAHLDHIGALPYVAQRYKADIISTQFTIEVLKSLYLDNKLPINNRLVAVQPNASYYVQGKNKKYQIDFINITHSTLQTSMIALHTDEGIFLYCNDFKFDHDPILGKEPNYDLLKKVAKQGVKAMVVDSLYSSDERKTPSEKIARGLLEDVMMGTSNDKAGILVTTFSSHIARLKSIVDFSKKLNRKPVFLGRSLNKYVAAAINSKLCPFAKEIIIARYKNQVQKMLKRVNKDRDKYVIVSTGHQGEPGSILDRLSKGQLPYNFNHEDHVIFSSSIIPAEANINNRKAMDEHLKKKGVRIFNNVHVSGHPGREDLRDFVNMMHAEHVIPAHGDHKKLEPMIELCIELGYKKDKTVHLMSDSGMLEV
jgi:ribonuclease J